MYGFKILCEISKGTFEIEAEWGLYVSSNFAVNGTDNDLSPDRRQAILWTNAGKQLITHRGNVSIKC